jgi:hypothetical protein
MKKKAITALLLIMTLCMSLALSACGNKKAEPQTLEEYAANNEEIQNSIVSAMEDSQVAVSIKGNDILYSYDLSNAEGYTEDIVKDEKVVESLQSSLEKGAPTFVGIIKTIEEETGMTGIRVIVTYNFGDEEIASRTYTENDKLPEESKEGSEEGENSESEEESE